MLSTHTIYIGTWTRERLSLLTEPDQGKDLEVFGIPTTQFTSDPIEDERNEFELILKAWKSQSHQFLLVF